MWRNWTKHVSHFPRFLRPEKDLNQFKMVWQNETFIVRICQTTFQQFFCIPIFHLTEIQITFGWFWEKTFKKSYSRKTFGQEKRFCKNSQSPNCSNHDQDKALKLFTAWTPINAVTKPKFSALNMFAQKSKIIADFVTVFWVRGENFGIIKIEYKKGGSYFCERIEHKKHKIPG